MTDVKKDVPWRSMLHSAGEVLVRDAFNDNADPDTLIARAEAQLELVRAELRDRAAAEST